MKNLTVRSCLLAMATMVLLSACSSPCTCPTPTTTIVQPQPSHE